MSSEMTLPTIPILEDSPLSGVPASESATAEENRILRLRVMEMWDAWTNGKEPPNAIPRFPELIPRPTGTSNVPISHPNIPLGQPIISAHYMGGTSEVRPQVFMPGTAPNIFTAPPCSATVQPSLPKPTFDPWVFPFQKPVFQVDPPSPTYAYPHPPSYEITPGQDQTPKAPEQDGKYNGHGLHGFGGKEELLMDFANSRILSQSAIRATSQAIQGGSGGMAKSKTRKETTMAASGERRYWTARPRANRNQPPFQRNKPPHQNHYNPRPPRNNFRPREPPRKPNYTPIGEPYSTLFPKLVQMKLLQPIPPNRQNPESPSYQRGVRCAYHSGMEGHDTNDCWNLKIAVENLIEQGKIVLRGEDVPNATNNPMPAHNNGPVIGMVSEDKEPEKKIDVPKQAYVVWGTIKPPWLNEPVVIGRIPQKPEYSKEEDDEIFTAEEGDGIRGAMRKVLCETHMVQPGEDTSTAGVLYTGPSAKLQNLKAMPFLIRRESQ